MIDYGDRLCHVWSVVRLRVKKIEAVRSGFLDAIRLVRGGAGALAREFLETVMGCLCLLPEGGRTGLLRCCALRLEDWESWTRGLRVP